MPRVPIRRSEGRVAPSRQLITQQGVGGVSADAFGSDALAGVGSAISSVGGQFAQLAERETNRDLADARRQGLTADQLRREADREAKRLQREADRESERLRRAAEREAERNEGFAADTELNNFKLGLGEQVTEIVRGLPEGNTSLVSQVNDFFEKSSGDFLSKVPPRLQPEYAAKLSSIRLSVLSSAFDTQLELRDGDQGQALNQALALSQTIVAATPSTKNTDAEFRVLAERVTQSDLPEQVKADLLRTFKKSLLTTELSARQRQSAMETAPADGIEFIRREEGFRASPYPDTFTSDGTSAGLRIGHGSSTVTFPDGSFRAVREGDSVTREDADRDLRRRYNTEFGPRAARQVGSANWAALPLRVKGALVDVAYHYGRLPGSVVRAAQTGDVEAIAGAVESLTANPPRRRREAAIIRGGAPGTVQGRDPLTNSIAQETRYTDSLTFAEIGAASRAGLSEAQGILLEQEKQDRAEYNRNYEALLLDLVNERAGEVEVENWRSEGLFRTASDQLRAEKIIADREEGLSDQALVQTRRDSPNPFLNNADPADRKAYNSVAGDVPAELTNPETREDYITAFLGDAQLFQALPTNLVSGLNQLAFSNTPDDLIFALDSLRQFQETAPEAYQSAIPNLTKNKVDQWSVLRQYRSDAEATAALIGGGTKLERETRAALVEDAGQLILDGTVEPLAALEGNLDTNAFFDAAEPDIPFQLRGLVTDFTVLFKENFALGVSQDDAIEMTIKQMRNLWGQTTIGEDITGGRLMKFPPEQMGYTEREIVHFSQRVRESLDLAEDAQFRLIGDTQTQVESESFRSGEADRKPSYKIVTFDATGIPTVAAANGIPIRFYYQRSARDGLIEELQLDLTRGQGLLEINRRNREIAEGQRVAQDRDRVRRFSKAELEGLALEQRSLVTQQRALEAELERLNAFTPER